MFKKSIKKLFSEINSITEKYKAELTLLGDMIDSNRWHEIEDKLLIFSNKILTSNNTKLKIIILNVLLKYYEVIDISY